MPHARLCMCIVISGPKTRGAYTFKNSMRSPRALTHVTWGPPSGLAQLHMVNSHTVRTRVDTCAPPSRRPVAELGGPTLQLPTGDRGRRLTAEFVRTTHHLPQRVPIFDKHAAQPQPAATRGAGVAELSSAVSKARSRWHHCAAGSRGRGKTSKFANRNRDRWKKQHREDHTLINFWKCHRQWNITVLLCYQVLLKVLSYFFFHQVN
jgi:hypothetical protein